MRKFWGTASAGLLVAALAGLIGLTAQNPACAGGRTISGEYGLAGAWTGGLVEAEPGAPATQSLVALGRLCVAPAGGHGARLELRIRHPFYDDRGTHYWRSKRECVIEGTAPLARGGLTGFVTWTRAYSGPTNGYCLAGIRKGF